MCIVFAVCVVEVLPWRMRAYFIESSFICDVVAKIRPEVLHPISNMEMEMHMLDFIIMVCSVCSVARPKTANCEALTTWWQIYVSHCRNCCGSHPRFSCWRYWQNPPGHLRTSNPVNSLCYYVMIYRVALSFQVSVNKSKVVIMNILNISGEYINMYKLVY